MTITYGFFNSINQDRKYNAAQIGRYLQYIVGSGVFPYVSTSLQVLANDGMTVEVQAGRAMLDHHYLDNDAPITLTLTAGGAQDRVDAIIMYVDMTERACGITIKEGTPAASPAPPAMTRTDVRKEYMLAKVRVPKLSSSITQSNITDTRPDSTVCGWVAGLINQVDTSTLFLQWQTAYEEEYARTQEYLAAQRAAWQAFFDSVTHDNVLPAPALDEIGYVVTVNETGTGYVLMPAVTTDDTLTQTGKAADAAAVGKALTVPNLLDNSNFALPVNQNGKTSYTGIGYGIEKWFSSSGYCAVTLNDGYVNIKSTNGSSAAYLLQFVELGKIKSGKKYTAVCKLKDGSFHAVTAAVSTAMTEAVKYIYVGGVQLGTIRLKYDAGQAQYAVLFSTTTTTGIDVEHVALYEGEYTEENMPVYRPRGYSIEAAICGGAGLNFKVVGGTTQPSNPSENTIWVNTSATITSWIFSATEPANPTEGMVWITIGTSSTVAFNALKKNGIQVYPIAVKQYVSGKCVDKTAKSYQGGKWVDWIPSGALYWDGIDRTNFTGGWESLAVNIIDAVNSQNALSVENYNGYVKIYQANGGARGLYVTKNKIRINGYSSLKLSGEIYSLNGNPIVVALMTDKTKNGVIASYSFAQHGTTKTFDDESIITLPSSGGEYYVGIGIASSDGKYVLIKNLYLD